MKPIAVAILALVMAMVFSFSASATVITSTPDVTIQPYEKYNYTVTTDNPLANLYVNHTGTWLIVSHIGTYTNLSGIPQDGDVGSYYVNITMTDVGGTVYQNFTIDVTPNMLSWQVGLAVIFGFGLIAIGCIPDMRFMLFLAGIVWIFAGIGIFLPFGIFFVIVSLGLGMVLMVFGGMSLGEETD